jgi:Tol biopolymer transport system component
MEFVEGEDLSMVLARGALPAADALPIAKQICEALEAAHEQGIIHRDLKPANIKVRADGTVKVLDFGLAKALDPGARTGNDVANSPTLTAHATRQGFIVGTAAYMAPEQARGRAVDRRADIWAFGVVLYEMLTGRRAFDGEDSSDVIASVLRSEPEWAAVPANTPARARELLMRCLVKDPRQRLHDIGDARLEIEYILSGKDQEARTSAVAQTARGASPSRVWRLAPWVLTTAAILAAAAVFISGRRSAPAASGMAAGLSVELPDDLQVLSSPPAVSPDGRRLAFAALGKRGIAIYVRDLDRFEVRQVAGSDGGYNPFFSPDGQWIGFITGSLVKKAPAEGGQASALARPAFWVAAATWAADGRIVVSGLDSGLWALPTEPGPASAPVELTRIDAAAGERAHRDPVALPDGRLLFTVLRERGGIISAYDPATKRVTPLDTTGSPVAYLPSGQLVFRQAGRLVSAPFDLSSTRIASQVTPILPEAAPDAAAFSRAGVVAYLYHPEGTRRDLVYVDRTGAYRNLVNEVADYRWPRLSPDGRRIAVGALVIGESRLAGAAIWVFDLATGSHTRLQDDGVNTEPVWTSDSRRVIYSSNRGAGAGVNLYWQAADGSGNSELLSRLPFEQWPTDVSRDGGLLAFYGQPKGQGYGIWTVTLDGAAKAEQVLSSTGVLRGARFSPDGRWIAYASDETGRFEVYVRPFPGLQAKWAVSSEGGVSPAWSPDGKELFFRNGSRMMVADVKSSPAFSTGAPRVLFEGPFAVDLAGDIDYDVAPDGKHFLMMLVARASQPRLRVHTQWAPEAATR